MRMHQIFENSHKMFEEAGRRGVRGKLMITVLGLLEDAGDFQSTAALRERGFEKLGRGFTIERARGIFKLPRARRGSAWRAPSGDAVANELETLAERGALIGHRVAPCGAASVSAFCVRQPLERAVLQVSGFVFYRQTCFSSPLLFLPSSLSCTPVSFSVP